MERRPKGQWEGSGGGALWATVDAGSSRGSRLELNLPFQASRCRSRRNALSPLRSASDAPWTGGLGVKSSHCWSPSGGPRQPKNSGTRTTCSQSLGAPGSSEACTGALRWCWEKPVDRGDSWSPGAAPSWDPGSALRPSLRRPSLGDTPAEGHRQEWPREPPARYWQRAKDHSPRTVAWADL